MSICLSSTPVVGVGFCLNARICSTINYGQIFYDSFFELPSKSIASVSISDLILPQLLYVYPFVLWYL